jgi:ferritin-like metal-binding protein YciE
MPIPNTHELMIRGLADLYDAEDRITDAIDAMIDMASSDALKEIFKTHREETQEQIARLERIFEILEIQPQRKECVGIKGILAEGTMLIDETEGNARDGAIIAAAIKVEHYEMACYGMAFLLAEMMQHQEIADLLSETLSEEENAEQLLLEAAQSELDVTM